ncbi:MAG: PQQ-dependent sugar dehydrogenase [Thermoproteota archaeon]
MPIILAGILCLALLYPVFTSPAYGQAAEDIPRVRDSTLRVELVSEGLLFPTGMAFLDNSTLLVAQKNNGRVAVVDPLTGAIGNASAIDVRVNAARERGLIGIAAASGGNGTQTTFVFLYFTESNGVDPIRNKLYRYEWNEVNQSLVNQTLILDLPAGASSIHNGGRLEVDGQHVYAVIGDQNQNGLLQNVENGTWIPDTSVIFRMNLDGSTPADNPFYNITSNEGIRKYYAYGIRNSFGLASDPLTGTFWDTENGQFGYDEVNLVEQGFNSGWKKVMGPMSRNVTASDQNSTSTPPVLISLGGSQYSDPEFSWKGSVAPTDIEFLNSTRLGEEYAYNIFVGDFNNGNLYFFTVNEARDGLVLGSDLEDLVADNQEELSQVVFGTGFSRGIADIETGPDGYLYVLTFGGMLYRIMPAAA